MEPKLSPNIRVGLVTGIPRQRSMYRRDMASSVAVRIAINSAQYVLVAMHPCLQAIQLTRVEPTITMIPDINLLVLWSCV